MDARCVSVQLIQILQLTKPEEDLKPAGHQSSRTEKKIFPVFVVVFTLNGK